MPCSSVTTRIAYLCSYMLRMGTQEYNKRSDSPYYYCSHRPPSILSLWLVHVVNLVKQTLKLLIIMRFSNHFFQIHIRYSKQSRLLKTITIFMQYIGIAKYYHNIEFNYKFPPISNQQSFCRNYIDHILLNRNNITYVVVDIVNLCFIPLSSHYHHCSTCSNCNHDNQTCQQLQITRHS